jgi:hypothetical protein
MPTKTIKANMSPEGRLAKKRVLQRKYATIHDFAAELIKLEHHRDPDGREIGLDYGEIHALILRKFPIVKTSGPHKGKPTKMSFKELQAITGELNRNGVKLPFRPRRKVKKKLES